MPIMNRATLVEEMTKGLDLPASTVAKVVEALENTIMDAVASGTDVKLMGFLSVENTIRSARTLRNPRTGEDMEVPASRSVRVRAMKNFRDRIEQSS